ncbi:acetylxylan esterase [Spirochaetota bacterium]
MATKNIDNYFFFLPPLDRENDFDPFWEKAVSHMKKIPLEPVFNKAKKQGHNDFVSHDVSFLSFKKTLIKGKLLIPKKVKKPKVIIYIHDYNTLNRQDHLKLDKKSAYFFITLRGHENIEAMMKMDDFVSPGFLAEHILNKDMYYVKDVYLDVYRSIDMLRLNNELDCSKIGIIGKGLGGAAALFTAAFSKRITALVLESPSFCYLPLSQNISTNDATNEINGFINSSRKNKSTAKKNLTYFDSLNFADKINCFVLAITGFKDTKSPPQCILGLFNHLQCEKNIEIYPDRGNEGGGDEQFQKSIKWIIGKINK